MPSQFDARQQDLVIKAADALKQHKEITPPVWAGYVKTGMSRERPPVEKDWWYLRSASVLRRIRVLGPIGTSKLRRFYGGRKNRGYAPERFYKGSGNIIRKILQQLDKAGLSKQVDVQGHKGRIATAKGMSLLDKAAQQVLAKSPKKPIVPEIQFTEVKQDKPKKKGKKPAEEGAEQSAQSESAAQAAPAQSTTEANGQ